jgi:hypothetical protein
VFSGEMHPHVRLHVASLSTGELVDWWTGGPGHLC